MGNRKSATLQILTQQHAKPMWTPELTLKVLDILHDALKIVGGGVVGGFFAWRVAKHQTNSALQKLRFEHRTRVLEEVLAKTVALNGAFVAFYGYANALISGGRPAAGTGIELTSGERPLQTLSDKVRESGSSLFPVGKPGSFWADA